MPFPESDRRRLLKELRELSSRMAAPLRVVCQSPPTVEGILDTGAGPRRYRVLLPPDYPFRPPMVWELNGDSDDFVDHRSTGHAYPDGSICLFGHRPEDGWRPEFTAGTAVGRLRDFLDAADRSAFPRVEDVAIPLSRIRVSIHPKLLAALRANHDWGMMAGWCRADGSLVVVTEVERTGRTGIVIEKVIEQPSQPLGAAMGLAAKWQGAWCRIEHVSADAPPSKGEISEWLSRVVKQPAAHDYLMKQSWILLVTDQAAWMLWPNPPPALEAALQNHLLYAEVIEEEIPAKLFARSDALFNEDRSLRSAHVAIVGLGSLGSGIAVALAKAGVGRFTLFDPDMLAPENVARHVGGVGEIGLPKVEVAARAIWRVNPEALVARVPVAISLDPAGWAGDSMAQLKAVLSDPNGLVVCATATADSERVLNALCVAQGTPAVFSSVLGRAEHGRIFRVIPRDTACYQCVLMAQGKEPTRFPRFEGLDVGTPAYHQPGIPGLGLDIDEIGLITARLTLQTLALKFAGGLGYPEAPGHHIIWSARGNWAVDGPLQTRIERIQRQPDCPICGELSAAPLDAQEEEELARLIAGSPV